MAKQVIDLTGRKFGKLIVLKIAGKNEYNNILWLCKCECGNTKIVRGNALKAGKTLSCGCYSREVHTKHGMWKSRVYGIWHGIITRCYCEKDRNYKHYGGRGIAVCDDWLGKNGAKRFIEWALTNGYDDTLTIDRKDNNGNYEPSNCRWIVNKEQQNNKRNNHYITFNGRTQSLSQWAEELNINRNTLYLRINTYHWDIERALTTPARQRKTA